ncbi:WecB/TagA/CpsF family glycosyltransferase [Leptolyngbya sp. AN02str]|uniref:WecB/TagA/CpsF family glycosyltransferase n=1 Tax=Leptolyngbya sp. AN02str TaxID=3423363 RepID=UPI003D315D37
MTYAISGAASPLTHVSIFGVEVENVDKPEAIALMEDLIRGPYRYTHRVSFVNAHTLNYAVEQPDFKQILNDSTYVFGDGTGVRWSAKVRGVTMKDNLVGTDLIPEFFDATANKGYRYFLLGADAATIRKAARYAATQFPGWDLVGFHHGYLTNEQLTEAAIAKINQAQPHVLLVGMGNPIQERWIHRHRNDLYVPLAMGVGGLFDHWGGNLKRAPLWVRKLGFEWLQLLSQQPHKWKRYIPGNAKFLARMILIKN